MSTLIELTSAIIASQAASSSMTTEEIIKSIQLVHSSLKALESGVSNPDGTSVLTDLPKMTIKKAFGKNEIFCLVCGKGGFKTLTRHLLKAHQMKPSQYRKHFNIPSSQSLTAKIYSDSRRSMAIEMNLGAGLVKGRAIRKANAEKKSAAVSPAVTKKVSVTAAKKTTAPVEKTKAPVPMIREKAQVPAKIVEVKSSVKTKKTPVVHTSPKSKK